MICKQFVGKILKQARAHLFAQLNSFKYCYLALIIQFNKLNGSKYCDVILIQF